MSSDPSSSDIGINSQLKSSRLKLLTLLNVISSKPSRNSTTDPSSSSKRRLVPEDRDWISISNQSINKKQKQRQDSTTAIEDGGSNQKDADDKDQVEDEKNDGRTGETKPKDEPNPDSNKNDAYDFHFGPESDLLRKNQTFLKSFKTGRDDCKDDGDGDEKNWKIDSNKRDTDGNRIVTFKPIINLPETDPSSSLQPNSDPVTVIPSIMENSLKNLNVNQTKILDSIKTYQDVWHTDLPYDENRSDPRIATSLWILQHIYKTRNLVLKNNEYLAHSREKKQDDTKTTETSTSKSDEPNKPKNQNRSERDTRDQGFTRPKILLLLPFRSTALEWLNTIVSILPSSNSKVKGLERFRKEYTLPDGTIDKLESDEAELKYSFEHRMIFKGNVDDEFKLGIKLNRKEFKIYSELYQSDIIIGSPVGLRKLIEKEGDADFLSSIEIVVADQMDVMLMQNWDHVEFVFEHLNQIPKKPRDTDFSRVKPWYLDSLSRLLRQSILFSSTISPELNSLFRVYLKNLSGKSMIFNKANSSSIRDGLLWKFKRRGIQQTFLKFELNNDNSLVDDSDKDELIRLEEDHRFEFFREKVFNRFFKDSAIVKAGLGGILIFVPSYFDFVRLENFFSGLDEFKFASISEYSTNAEITAARSSFFNRHVSFLLITERFHFYNRFKIRGAKTMIFYGLPINKEFYLEYCDEYPFLSKNPSSKNSKSKNKKKNKSMKSMKNDQEAGDFRDDDDDDEEEEEEEGEEVLREDEFKVYSIFSELDKYKLERIIGISNYDDDSKGGFDEDDGKRKGSVEEKNCLMRMIRSDGFRSDRNGNGPKFVFV